MKIFENWPYIVAVCREQAVNCAKMNSINPNNFFYIGTVAQVRGICRGSEVWVCGDYHDLKQWPEIEKELKARGLETKHKVC